MVWAGHTDLRTTQKYYSKVQKSDFERATGVSPTGVTAPSVASVADENEEEPVILQFAS
jgi:hypothetical protein